MWVLRSILILVLIVMVVGFALYNSGAKQTVDINLIWAQRADVPVITVVFWSFILGAMVSWLLFISVYLRLTNQIRSSNRNVKGLQSEVTALRNRPIEESHDLLGQKDKRQE
jgi:uncharacterized membrane protein YciS (DUF1049 family)